MPAQVDTGSDPVLNYLAEQGKAAAATTNNQTAMAVQQGIQANATKTDISGAENIAAGQAMAAASMDAVKLQTSAENANARTMLGADPLAANYRLQELTNQRTDAYNKANDIAKTIADKQSLTFINDPLGFINAQFTLPADIAQHNYYANLHNSAADEYTTIVSQTTATAQENTATAATMTTAAALAKQQEIQGQSQQAVAKAQQTGAQLAIEGISKQQALTDDQLNQAHMAVQVKDEQTRIAMQQANFGLVQAQKKIYLGILQDSLERKTAALEDQNAAVTAYNKAADKMGAPRLPATTVIAKLRQKDPQVAEVLAYGQRLQDALGTGETVPVSGSMAQAGALYNSTPGMVPTGTSAPTAKFLASTVAELHARPEIQAIKDPSSRLDSINATLSGVVATQAKTIYDDKPNVYSAPPAAALIAATPALSANSFVSSIVMPQAQANPSAAFKANDIVSAGIAAVAKDPSQLDSVAEGINKIGVAAVNYNNNLKGYQANNVPLQTNYPAALNTGMFGGTQTVELTDLTAIKTLLMRKQFGTIPMNMNFGE